MKSFIIKLVSNAFAHILLDKTPSFHRPFTGAIESGGSMGGLIFGNVVSINVPKCYEVKYHVF